MVLGMVAVSSLFLECILSIPLAIVGLPLGAVSFYQKEKAGEGKGMAIAGMATCGIVLIWVFIVLLLLDVAW